MKVKLLRTYRAPKTGNPVFVYTVSGNEADLAAYEEAQGEHFRTDENGQPLWFTVRCIGDSGELIITSKGNIVADMSRFDQAASLASQYGGNFGEALAQMTAASILGNAVPQANAAPSAPEAHASDVASDDTIQD